MPFELKDKLVVAVSSSAAFNMLEADEVFNSEGLEAYREYQRDHIDEPFSKGVAFPFIKRLLKLNETYPELRPIEVIVLSKNDPDTGRRFFRSCHHYGLQISRGAFLNGGKVHEYVSAFNCCLFLSAHKEDVKSAIEASSPAGLVLPTKAQDDDDDGELRIAFDFDGVIADDESEKVYKDSNDLSKFHSSEQLRADQPHNPGPLGTFIKRLAVIQQWEKERSKQDKDFRPALRISIVTARDFPANERMVTTLASFGIDAVEAFFLGGVDKSRVLEVLKPHIFFEDQMTHLKSAAEMVPSVHIPFGIRNQEFGEAQP